MSVTLFRAEALAHQQSQQHGNPLNACSPDAGWITACVMLAVVALVGYAFWGHYTRKEHVSGYLSPTAGLIKIYTPQAGTVLERRVHEGEAVKKGQVLLVISSERATDAAPQAQAAMQTELRQRRDSLQRERAKQGDIDALAAQGLAERMRNLQAEIDEAQAQLALQRARVAGAERTVSRNQALLVDHFVSEATVQQKQEELLDQRQQLAQTQRNITSLTRELDAARVEHQSAGLKRSNNASAIERQVSELDQQLTESDTRRGVVLTAPADGTVTTILAEPGQNASVNAPLLSILPAGAQLRAELLVPTRAAGFIQPGQEVALRYQAFAYQRFGHHVGEVIEVGRTVIQPNEASPPLPVQEPVYRVVVRLPAQWVRAYGQAMPLQSGMALDADIHIDRRRLIDWVFEPVLSIAGRV